MSASDMSCHRPEAGFARFFRPARAGRRRQDGLRPARRLAAARPRCEERRGTRTAAVPANLRPCGAWLAAQPGYARTRQCRRHCPCGEAAGGGAGDCASRADGCRLHARRVDHGRADAAIPLRRAEARVRIGARHAEHPGRDRPRHHRRGAVARQRRAAQSRTPPAFRDRRGRVDRRRGVHGCGDGGVRVGTGLRLPARRSFGASGRRGRAAAASRGKTRARNRRRRGRVVASIAARRRRLARERDLAGRHHGRGA